VCACVCTCICVCVCVGWRVYVCMSVEKLTGSLLASALTDVCDPAQRGGGAEREDRRE